MNGDIAKKHEGYGQKPATGSDQTGNHADAAAHGKQAQRAGQLPVRLGLEVEHHLEGGIVDDDDKDGRHRSGRNLTGHQ